MLTFLNSQQLAFILEIKKEDARAKMCYAWCKYKGIENEATRNTKNKIVDSYPQAMPIEVLSKELNLPMLQDSVNDICNNFLNRPGTKKWILCDFPEKEIKSRVDKGMPNPYKINIPPALKSMLPTSIQNQIMEEWRKRYNA